MSAFLLLSSKGLQACSCYNSSNIPYPNIFEFNYYQSIALVKIIASDSCYKSKVEILESFRGDLVKGKQVTVYNESTATRKCNSSCDEYLSQGVTYVVFLEKKGEHYINPGMCCSTHPIDEKTIANELYMLRYLRDFNLTSSKYIHLQDLSGHSVYKGFIKDGHPDLNWVMYRNGSVYRKGAYNQGLEEGIWTLYHMESKTHIKGVYAKGRKIGIWKKYDADNKVIEIINTCESPHF